MSDQPMADIDPGAVDELLEESGDLHRDAMAVTDRALDDLVDFALRGRGRGVEHLAPAIAIGRVDTVQEDGVKMRVQSQVAVGTLNDGQGARLAGRQAALNVALPIPPRDCVREDTHHLPQQFPVECQR